MTNQPLTSLEKNLLKIIGDGRWTMPDQDFVSRYPAELNTLMIKGYIKNTGKLDRPFILSNAIIAAKCRKGYFD